MSEHYSKQTVSVSVRCNVCNKATEHRVDKGLLGPCLRCAEKRQVEHTYHEQERRRERNQGNLFQHVL